MNLITIPDRGPISVHVDRAGDTVAPNLLVMLPGARDAAQDFVRHGFIQAVHEQAAACDVAALDAHMDYYLAETLVTRLHQDIILPALASGARHIWLLGISLGGMGCLRYVRAYPDMIAGLILLAPFLATRGLIAEVSAAGGFVQWRAGDTSTDSEREFLAWLQQQPLNTPPFDKLFLAYGEQDRFAPASILLQQRLPAARSIATAGAHDWPTWNKLWRMWLAKENFWHAAH